MLDQELPDYVNPDGSFNKVGFNGTDDQIDEFYHELINKIKDTDEYKNYTEIERKIFIFQMASMAYETKQTHMIPTALLMRFLWKPAKIKFADLSKEGSLRFDLPPSAKESK